MSVFFHHFGCLTLVFGINICASCWLTPTSLFLKSEAPGSLIKHIQVAAERLQALLSLPKKTFVITIRSNFLCDENSIILTQDFTLLNLQFPR